MDYSPICLTTVIMNFNLVEVTITRLQSGGGGPRHIKGPTS